MSLDVAAIQAHVRDRRDLPWTLGRDMLAHITTSEATLRLVGAERDRLADQIAGHLAEIERATRAMEAVHAATRSADARLERRERELGPAEARLQRRERELGTTAAGVARTMQRLLSALRQMTNGAPPEFSLFDPAAAPADQLRQLDALLERLVDPAWRSQLTSLLDILRVLGQERDPATLAEMLDQVKGSFATEGGPPPAEPAP